MKSIGERYVEAESLSAGWLGAAQKLFESPGRKAVHLMVRIARPEEEDETIRTAAATLIAARNAKKADSYRHFPPIETTRTTIFPATWAERFPEPTELAAYYRERYHSDLGGLRYFKHNERGTYFGRVVAYPRFGKDAEPADQLSETVRKLRDELKGVKKGSGPKRARYEINIYNERCDRNPMSFPCLAHLSIHLDGKRRLHMQAIYRNEHIVARGYGNFQGLAELQAYIAKAVGVDLGELLMTIGHGELDVPKKLAMEHLGELWTATGTE
jgi:thymidylate synthase